MKHTFQYILLLLILGADFTSCNKTTDTQSTTTPTTDTIKTVGGITSAYKDTVEATINKVTLKYSRTSQCYPSNEIFAFTASATSLPTGATLNWDFGDGHTINGAGNGATVGNIYASPGKYTVTLTIKDGNKVSLSVTTVNVAAHGQQVSPHASFYAQIFDINYPNNYNFNANGSSVTNGHISNYYWIWGDSTTTSAATADNTPHNFPQVAKDVSYPVQLIVTSSEGCKDTAYVPVSIAAIYNNISGDFDTVQNNPCTAEYFTFTSNAKNIPQGAVFTWDFSDATGTSVGNPIQHTFTYQNTFDVKMYVSMNGKIIYTTHKSVWANGQNVQPTALFFKNVSYEDSTYVKWAMYSAGISPPHGYIATNAWYMDDVLINTNTNDTYEIYEFNKKLTTSQHTIKHIVTSNVGCKDTATSSFVVPIIGKYTY